MEKISTCLWFNGQAEQAAKFYTSVFKNSKVIQSANYGDAGPGLKGSVMTVTFSLDGKEFIALNGGPEYQYTPAISLVVKCKDQSELDYYWEKLSEGGEKGVCGWLTDKFGVSWQVVPEIMGDLVNSRQPEKSDRVMQAVLQMTKLDIAQMKAAYERS